MNHYTYMLVDPISEMKYVGVRSCKTDIEDDPYKGSSSTMSREEKNRYVKLILGRFNTREEANLHEIELHTLLNVVSNKSYWNIVHAEAPPRWTGGYRKLPKISTGKKDIPLTDAHREALKVAQQKRWSEGRGPAFKYGEDHAARRYKSTYKFKNLDGQEFVGTNLDFKAFMKARHVQTITKIVTGDHAQYKGWYIVENLTTGCKTTDSKYVDKYLWKNDEKTFIGTGYQFAVEFNIPLGDANKVLRGERSNTKGWKILSKVQIETEYHQTV